MKSKGLYLCKNKKPPNNDNIEWDIVTNYIDFTKYIVENGIPAYISLDHDLDNEHIIENIINKNNYCINYDEFEEKTGYDCISWLIDYVDKYNVKLHNIIIDTDNERGRKNMFNLINNYKMFKKLDFNIYALKPKNNF